MKLIADMFEYFDTDSDKHILAPQAVQLLSLLGYPHVVVNAPRQDLPGFLVFLNATRRSLAEDDTQARVRRAFKLIDKPESRSLDAAKLGGFLRSVGLAVPAHRLDRMVELIGDGDHPECSETEFVRWVMQARRLMVAEQRAASRAESAAAAA